MNCARWQRLVALYVGDDLDRSRTARVAQHLAACPSCRALEHDLRSDRLHLRDLDSAAADGLELGSVRGAVMAKIENRRKRSLMFSQPRLLSALAMVVVVIALALVGRQSQAPDDPRTASRNVANPASGSAADQVPLDTPRSGPPPAVVDETPNASNNLLARAETPPRASTTRVPPSAPVEPMTIKILTDDPEVVIYWIVDPKGDNKNV